MSIRSHNTVWHQELGYEPEEENDEESEPCIDFTAHIIGNHLCALLDFLPPVLYPFGGWGAPAGKLPVLSVFKPLRCGMGGGLNFCLPHDLSGFREPSRLEQLRD